MLVRHHTCLGLLLIVMVSCNTLQTQLPIQRLVGICKTYQEFLDNKPSITKAFTVVRDTSIMFDELRQIMDTTIRKVKYSFLDGSRT
jgi:hypothetical protein